VGALSLDDNIRALSRTPVLADVGRDALRLLAFSAEEVHLRPGDLLFAEGEDADSAFTVVSGRIRLEPARGEIRVVGRGALIGEMALIVEGDRPCHATAEDEAKLLSIPRPVFLKMLGEFPNVAKQMRARFAARLRAEHAALDKLQKSLAALPGAKADG
jgi:CRP-like cAMP-binding protein